jgi:hypothetical protein
MVLQCVVNSVQVVVEPQPQFHSQSSNEVRESLHGNEDGVQMLERCGTLTGVDGGS